MSINANSTKKTEPAIPDLVWGAKDIGREINRTPRQVYYLFENGALGDAVTKLGHKTLVGSRRKLRNLV